MIDAVFSAGKAQRRNFTLVELVVAIAIITLTLAVAVSTLRGESPAQKMERTVHEIGAFCARVRFRAAEEGRDWVLKYDPEEGKFFAEAVSGEEDGNIVPGDNSGKYASEKEKESDAPPLPRMDLKLDKSFSFETAEGAESQLANGELLEVFRFFPDGGASGSHKLVLKLRNMQKVFHISKLTGRILIDGDLSN